MSDSNFWPRKWKENYRRNKRIQARIKASIILYVGGSLEFLLAIITPFPIFLIPFVSGMIAFCLCAIMAETVGRLKQLDYEIRHTKGRRETQPREGEN